VSSFLLIYCFSIFIILYFKGKLKENDENFFKKEIDRREKKKVFSSYNLFWFFVLENDDNLIIFKKTYTGGRNKEKFFPL
jgi:hypothetical protein